MAIRSLLFGVMPAGEDDKVCLERKRKQTVCVMVAKNEPCMGPMTRTGCGAICPSVRWDCYDCYGPAENVNTQAMANRLHGLGLVGDEVARRISSVSTASSKCRNSIPMKSAAG